MSQPVTLFYSYAHQDIELRDELELHLAILRRQGLVDDWHDRKIGAGTEWQQQILAQLGSAQIIVMLVTPHFIASDYCYTVEMELALERHRAGQARVIPILMCPCVWEATPLANLQVLPTNRTPVTEHSDRHGAFVDITLAIKDAAEAICEQAALTPQTAAERPSHDPLKSSALTLEKGAMFPNSPFYVYRRADSDARSQLASEYPTIAIKGYRQSGKSSLLVRLHHEAQETGHGSAYIDLQALDPECFKSLESLLH